VDVTLAKTNPFTAAELAYLTTERRLARVATVGPDGMPHVTPLGMWRFNPDGRAIDIEGHDFANTKKFRDVLQTRRATIVIDDVLPPWRPRGIEIRGEAEAIIGPPALIRIHPRRIVSWGLDATGLGDINARNVT